jgi:hypothetical protein
MFTRNACGKFVQECVWLCEKGERERESERNEREKVGTRQRESEMVYEKT